MGGLAMGKYNVQKKQVLDCIMALVEQGFVQGTGGNVSLLLQGGSAVAVTPSQREYATMTPDDICVVDLDLRPLEEAGAAPSMETAMHLAIYRSRPDAGAIVHTHQIFASVFSLINEPIPALFDEVAGAIGPKVEIVPYALSGSKELVDNVVSKLGNRANCYILQNHGALSLGRDLDHARRNAELLEKAAQVYYYALATGRAVSVLPQEVQDLMSLIIVDRQDEEIKRRR